MPLGLRCAPPLTISGSLAGRRAARSVERIAVHPTGLHDLGRLVAAVEQVYIRVVKVNAWVLPELLQIRQHGVGGDIALVHVGGHGLHGDLLQRLRDIRVNLTGRERDGVDVLDGHRDGRVSLIGQAAGQHLIEHHTGGIDIAAGVDIAAPRLLR